MELIHLIDWWEIPLNDSIMEDLFELYITNVNYLSSRAPSRSQNFDILIDI